MGAVALDHPKLVPLDLAGTGLVANALAVLLVRSAGHPQAALVAAEGTVALAPRGAVRAVAPVVRHGVERTRP